ncbi:DNA polymerase III, subunits gamma and tau [Pseudarthrobacter siccitolerans]|uniref:DNA polymerase III subunit gamma/tau n=1 Tax=Pseudarthrobacter siccitolerans TaxID=861266 RepID=A0A024H7A3_9MICC|nr:DNA polymerase III subunit gamma and tau [Pseudarthrobacter siccitolerans]CCQ47621.1 DNA polymerase III, subunits gamma and tau [Pseudarthrobacter siccitolerans]
MTVTTALYRRYRPDSFADVIGQEHVTEPLMTALRKNRVNHAYLFSGPRGCGKTTSARILARCLNCAKGPTDTPCGSCPSCVELARGGSGSLDVIEIDAASHGGVDDARDLRERATYAPVRDRYKIFIIDEAHMVTSAGFNALLKIVEEPPEHIKFIFATTEPDKVIGTIRSRTHHYPFRLVPPEPLMAYLELLCNQENVPVAPGVLSLVIRAGGGSVRDSLSVLDQLMAGAGPNGLDYELAVALLGYTHASLLDDVVEAVAASDSATVFRAVDRVIQTGHDPRRFVEDLLERFRDLIIVQAMPESAQTILRGMPADQIARLKNQAHNLGTAELSRAADVTNTALTEMTGATSPRLHLELLCARILLPSSEQNERGMAARIDRVERRLNYAGNDVGAPAVEPGHQPAPAGHAVPVGDTASATPPAPASVPGAARPEAASPAPAVQKPARTGPSSPAPAAAEPGAAHASQNAARPAGATGPGGTPAAAASPADGETRAPLTAPRVSTSDWPVEGSAGTSPAPAGSCPAPADPRSDERNTPDVRPEPAPVQPVQPAQPVQPNQPAQPVQPNQPAQPVQPNQPAQPVQQATVPAGQTQPGPASAGPAASAPPAAMGDVEVLRRAWPDVLQTLTKIKRSTWALVEPNAQVSAFDGQTLTLSFTTSGLAGAFGRAGHSENLRQAIHKTVGIDCQITAVAGSGGRTSSEPNPKAPASRPAPATSADVAWGLAPAAPATAAPEAPAPSGAATAPGQGHAPGSVAGQPGINTPGDRPAASDSGLHQGVNVQGASATDDIAALTPATRPAQPASAAPAAPSTPSPSIPVPSPQPAADSSAAPSAPADPYSGAAGDYSYSDDDWGPPRDEDAPPLDEEPPLDWDPSARSQPRSTRGGSAGQPSRDPGATVPSGASAAGNLPASQPGTRPTPGTPAGTGTVPATPSTGGDAPHDPWTRAVEQAPGVWVVGEESNIGKLAAAVVPEKEPAVSAPAHHYEPATAQIPPSIPVTSTASAVDAEWGLAAPASSAPQATGHGSEPSRPAPEPAREFAMASAAPAAAPVTAARQATVAPPVPAVRQAPAAAAAPAAPQAPTAPAASPAAAGTRQSLYQRLSNSPEAEAGRAKAPARTVPAEATYVQDIPSPDDETIEASGVFGRAAVERILGGKLIEERSLDGSPVPPRY